MQKILAHNSTLVFVWHDNNGQAFPENSPAIATVISEHGFTIDIQPNTVLTEPLIMLVSAANKNNAINKINIGRNSQVQIIEYLMGDDVNAENNVQSSINCAAGVQLNHCILQQAAINTVINQQATITINQARDSNVNSNIFSFGGKNSNIELTIALQEENASCQINSLAYTAGTEAQNVVLKIDHLVPKCTSKSTVRGVLFDNSITDFVGHIGVHPDAKYSIADLQIKNILCSPKAQANNRPELEIYNNEVRCSHGSSTGQMNEAALFYMRSRGLDEATATKMLLEGFIRPVIDSCTIPTIAAFIKGMIKEREHGYQ